MTPLSTPAAQGTVAGWKLVPVEPTEEMWKAADKQSEFCAIHNYGASPSAEDYWHAMLDAAPFPSPEALPASGVEAAVAIERQACAFLQFEAPAYVSDSYSSGFWEGIAAYRKAINARAALTSAPAPEDRT